ncbi:MAG: zinc ribbon domain-containing protein [Candidatus Manganitrophaceae bacterium]|nr:MAG: zinc ribbon domain-containing protein [Candidatus Manganitrophaceae bacterium]
MPIYEYTCQDCKKQFSLLQSISSRPEETACPYCGERKSRRLFSTFASKTNGETASSPAASGGHSHSGGCGCG